MNEQTPDVSPPGRAERAREFDREDGTIQALYGLGLQLENCIHLVDESPADAKAQLDAAISRLSSLIRELRRRIESLGIM